MRQPLAEQRKEKAVLGVLEYYEGIPLSSTDISEESGLNRTRCEHVLTRMHRRFIVQRRVQNMDGLRYEYWMGMPRL